MSSIVFAHLTYKSFPTIFLFLFKVLCKDETLDICTKVMFSLEVESANSQDAVLSNCDTAQIKRGVDLLFMVTRGSLSDYGKYEIMTVKHVNG